MVTSIEKIEKIEKQKPIKSKPKIKTRAKPEYPEYEDANYWPRDIIEADRRDPGPYTIENADTILDIEPMELYNGWLVWKKMTDPEERRIAANIQLIMDLVARHSGFGQAYPDNLECLMANGDELKPDVCLISSQRFEEKVAPYAQEQRQVLHGGPELVVELRSPSNRRTKERRKRAKYFANNTSIVWDVDPKKQKIWVYEVENPEQGHEYGGNDVITCEKLFPGWKRNVADFFAKDLSVEEIVGEAADQWRTESREEGRSEGEFEALRKTLLRLAKLKFGETNLPADFETRLANFDKEQLNQLTDTVLTSPEAAEWLEG